MKAQWKNIEIDLKSKTEMTNHQVSSLLLCNTTLIDVCRHLEDDIEVTCLPDANLEDLQATINKDNQIYNNVYLVTQPKFTGKEREALEFQYQKFLEASKAKASKVVVSSVLPISDINTEHLNRALKVLCQDAGSTFVDNDCNFKHMDGTINEDCFDEEKGELSEFGIKRLLRNLGLIPSKKKTKATSI